MIPSFATPSVKPNRVSQAADRQLPSYQEALGHASEGGQTATSSPRHAPPLVAKEHRKWVLAVVQNRLKLSPAEKQVLRDRSEKIKDINTGRLKLSSVSANLLTVDMGACESKPE